MSIPASEIVDILPGVVSAGGSPLALNTVVLTTNLSVPVGTVSSFGTADAVKAFFGPTSDEGRFAGIYFAGYDNSTVKPGTLFFARYQSGAVAAYLRSGSFAGFTLAQLQAIPAGALTLTVDGASPVTSSAINLSTATSFSDAAAKIATAIGASVTVTYDSQLAAFKIASATTGAASTITFATNTAAINLKFTAATGAVLSQGAIASVPGTAMDAVKARTQNWALFTSIFEPVIADKTAFAVWTNSQKKRFAYVPWDTDATPAAGAAPASFGYLAMVTGYNAVFPVYNTLDIAAFLCGAVGSIDYASPNARATMAFKSQDGLTATVTDAQAGRNLISNGYNFYGDYATANDGFVFFYPGSATGDFEWIDTYVNQIYLNAQFQLALMTLLTSIGSIPYNTEGYALMAQACADPINAAVTFGTIRANVPLSNLQAAQVNNQAGVRVSDILSTRGWFLQILPANTQARSARTTPPCKFWYTDGSSVQQITLSSIDVL